MPALRPMLHAAAGLALMATPAAADRPNVLFIAVDDLKPAIAAYGDPVAVTPNLDRLAERSTVFTNAHCQQAICGPSRASLMTGLRPDHGGVHRFGVDMRVANPAVVTIPEHFKAHGYTTVGIGKIYDHRNIDGHATQDARSWSRPYLHVAGRDAQTFGYLADEHRAVIAERLAEAEARGLVERRDIVNHVNHKPPFEAADVPDDAYSDGRRAAVAAQTIGELAAEDEPYFLAMGFYKPHLPFNAPQKYWDLYDPSDFDLAERQAMPDGAPEFAFQDSWELKNGYTHLPERVDGLYPEDFQREMIHGYYAAVSYIDAQLGLLLDAVEASGEADNTIVVLWGDHGFHLGDHGMWCKHTNYEQATRVPLLIAAPMAGQSPGAAATPTELIDLFPTLNDLAGLPTPDPLDGTSLIGVLADPAHRHKDVAMSQFPRRLDDDVRARGYAVRDDRFRYVEWRMPDADGDYDRGDVIARELYDYTEDPLETVNLAGSPDHAGAMDRLAARLDALVAEGTAAGRAEPIGAAGFEPATRGL